MAVSDDGYLYMTGGTEDYDFPLVNPYESTISGKESFLMVFENTGQTIIYSTVMGGNGDDWGQALHLGQDGFVYVTGITGSSNFPTVNPFDDTQNGGNYYKDGFVYRLNITNNDLNFSTYLGDSGWDQIYSIYVDDQQYMYVTGYTTSENFPLLNPLDDTMGEWTGDCFVAKFNPLGNTLNFSTFIGGNQADSGSGIIADEGYVYVAGYSTSVDFPLANPLIDDGSPELDSSGIFFVLNHNGSELLYSTYWGSSGGDSISEMVLTPDKGFCVVGDTDSSSFPRKDPVDNQFAGHQELFFSKFMMGTEPTTTEEPPTTTASSTTLTLTTPTNGTTPPISPEILVISLSTIGAVLVVAVIVYLGRRN
jgi:hypothetical protein